MSNGHTKYKAEEGINNFQFPFNREYIYQLSGKQKTSHIHSSNLYISFRIFRVLGANTSMIPWQQNIPHKLFHLRRSTLLAVYTKINIISNKITDRGSINYNKFPVTNFSRSSPCSNKAWSCSALFSSQFIEVTCCFIDSRVEADQDKLCGFSYVVTCATYSGRQTNYKTIERLEKQGSRNPFKFHTNI